MPQITVPEVADCDHEQEPPPHYGLLAEGGRSCCPRSRDSGVTDGLTSNSATTWNRAKNEAKLDLMAVTVSNRLASIAGNNVGLDEFQFLTPHRDSLVYAYSRYMDMYLSVYGWVDAVKRGDNVHIHSLISGEFIFHLTQPFTHPHIVSRTPSQFTWL